MKLNVNLVELKKAMKALNDSGLLEEKMKMIGKTPDLVEIFCDAMESAAEKDKKALKKLSGVVEYYNELVKQLEAGGEEPKEPEPKEPEPKDDFDENEKQKGEDDQDKELEVKGKKRLRKNETISGKIVDKNKKDKKEEPVEKKKTAKAKKEKGEPSNKLLVYKEWKKSKEKKTPDELFSFIEEKVKIVTIKSWINGWKKGKYLPAGIEK